MVKQVDMDEKGIITAFEDVACLFNYQYNIELVTDKLFGLQMTFSLNITKRKLETDIAKKYYEQCAQKGCVVEKVVICLLIWC